MSESILRADERLDKVNEHIALIQKKDGLTFGTDAYLLAAFIKAQRNAYAVELGAGTGIISLLLAARQKLAHIDALEIQEDFCELTQRNVEYNKMSDMIRVIRADVRDVRADTLGREADVVFSNPPYMTKDSGKRNVSDRKYIARHEVCGGIYDFCAAAYRLLKHGGRFYCVWRPDRLTSLISSMRANRLEPKSLVFVHSDMNSEPSMVLVSATKGAAEGLKMLPPLFMYDTQAGDNGERRMSCRAESIYATMSFYEE
ncbi:MAG: methyltransferase domain-containing protein [Ruminococcaceae bacterium]|nr:methyltransferase domain-containing protein [Oscillospiraceae bacterium]